MKIGLLVVALMEVGGVGVGRARKHEVGNEK